MNLFRKRPNAPFYLVSSAGVPNYGDELITRAWLDWLARHHPGVPVWLDCLEPGRANHLFADTHPLLRTTNTLWHLAFSGSGMSLAAGTEHVSRMVRDLGSPRFDLGLLELRRAQSVHLLGGGYLTSVWPHQLLLLPALKSLHEEYGVPLYATGQGLAPLEGEARTLVAECVSSFEVFVARDRVSAALAGAEHGVDDAFLAFENRRSLYSNRDLPDVLVLVQGDFDGEQRADTVVETVAAFIADRSPVRSIGVVESLPPDDAWIVPHLVERGVDVDFFPFMRLWSEGIPARAGQAWLSTRFHFHLLAAAAGAAGTVLNLHPDYYGIKHASLQELGTGWTSAELLSDIHRTEPHVDPEFGTAERRAAFGREVGALARRIYG